MFRLGIIQIPTHSPVSWDLQRVISMICNRCGTGRSSNSQVQGNDPVNKASPLEGAVHQAQKPWELHRVRWTQVLQSWVRPQFLPG